VLGQHAEITIFDLAKDKLPRALPHGRLRYLLQPRVNEEGGFPSARLPTPPGPSSSPS